MLWDKKPASTPTEDSKLLGELAGHGPGPREITPLMQTAQQEEPGENLLRETIPPPPAGRSRTILGQAVVVKGDLSGKEDLLIEGQCEGTLDFPDHCLTIGPQGKVKSEIRARQVVIHGTVNGKISAGDRVEIRKTGTVVGDIVSATVAIEDGAFFKGSIEIVREGQPQALRAASAVA